MKRGGDALEGASSSKQEGEDNDSKDNAESSRYNNFLSEVHSSKFTPPISGGVILRRLGVGKTPKEIARELGCSRRNVYSHINRLQAQGYLKIEKVAYNVHNYLLTPKGFLEALGRSTTPAGGSQVSPPEAALPGPGDSTTSRGAVNQLKHSCNGGTQQRLHALSVKFKILNLNELEGLEAHVGRVLTKKQIPWELRGLNNYKQFVFYRAATTIRVTTKSVIFDLPELYHNSTRTALRLIWQTYLADAVTFAERIIGVQLSAPGRDNVVIINAHNAFTVPELEEFCKEVGLTHLAVEDEHGEQVLVIDRSAGEAEVEAVHPRRSLEDSERLKRNFLALTRYDLLPILRRFTKHDLQLISQKRSTLTYKILKKVGEGHATPKELYAQIPDASRETIRGLLQKLLRRGELERPSKGVYTLPADSFSNSCHSW